MALSFPTTCDVMCVHSMLCIAGVITADGGASGASGELRGAPP